MKINYFSENNIQIGGETVLKANFQNMDARKFTA